MTTQAPYEPPPPPPESFGGTSGPSGPRAGFWRRFAAYFLDGVLISIPYLILWAIVNENTASLLSLVIGIVYFAYLEGSPSGQTIGKRALGIRVIDLNTGGSIGYGRAIGRYFARILSALVLLLGYLWMLWDKEKQTWHDKLVSSIVVPTDAYPVERWPG